MSALAVLHGAVLQGAGALVAAVEPSPSPVTTQIPAEDQTSPGLLGFLVTFCAALAVMGLAYAMVRQMRRVDHRARLQEQAERQEAERSGGASEAGPATGVAPSGGSTPSGEGPR